MARVLLVLLLLLPVTVGAAGRGQPEIRLLAIGDSMLQANFDEASPVWAADVLRRQGYPVVLENRSIGGTCLRGCGDTAPIGETYSSGGWTHVLLSAGGNDVIDDGCGPADPYLSADLQDGLLAELLEEVTRDGAALVLVGYPLPSVEGSSFWCPAVQDLMARYTALASGRADVEFIDARELMDPLDPSHYQDQIHPSVLGSRIVGLEIARVVLAHRPR